MVIVREPVVISGDPPVVHVNNKTKVTALPTNYNKNKNALVVKNVKNADYGVYMTGNMKKYKFVAKPEKK
ncbi:hypothetical protein GCK72_020361 [Caenorhabditis remanei]|uniref:Uncharacterized protein n=1 Tax=Caenorhabditis remanei TaxID=31234 RepID=A0A6A5GGB8_CAERE|nr:hypothetical protein GCK72_020361 [Caenorhabditis remanei]KAF1753804.1 hypothetical protein GCK72_020361 [Caenorhabditis remanei]